MKLPLHAGEHVQNTLGMFRYFLRHSALGGKKEKSSSVAATGWSKGAGLNLTSANTHTHTHVSRDTLGIKCIR